MIATPLGENTNRLSIRRKTFLCPRRLGAVAAIDSRVQSELRVEEELEQQPAPRFMRLESGVKFRRYLLQPWQPRPRHVGKIMVFVVIADVERDKV